MLIRLAQYAPVALVEGKWIANKGILEKAHISKLGLSALVDALKVTVTTKLNEGAVKQQVERNEEMIRSALRAIAAIAKIPNVESATKFDEFLKLTVLVPPLAEKHPNRNFFSLFFSKLFLLLL